MIDDVVEAIDAHGKTMTAERERGLGPSDAFRCRRALGYRERGEPITNPRDEAQSMLGKWIHDGIARAIEARYAPEERGVNVPLRPRGFVRDGEADDVWWARLLLTDVKTKSARAFEYVVNYGPSRGDLGQTMLYARAAAQKSGTDENDWTVRLLYVNRDKGGMHAEVLPFDKALADEAQTWVLVAQEQIDDGGEQPREGNGPGTGFPCDWCEWANVCWDVDNAPSGVTPQAHVLTVDDPAADEAAEAYLAASKRTSEAKKEQDAIKARLRIGTSPKFEVRYTGGNEQSVIDHDRLVAVAVEHDIEVPMTTTTTRRAIKVTRR